MSINKSVLALDVAFSNLGWAVLEHYDSGWKCVAANVLSTKKSDKKKKLRMADDDVMRCTELFVNLRTIAEVMNVGAVIAELPPGGSQNARANRAMGMSAAITAAVVAQLKLPAEYTTPTEGKVAATGSKTASKSDMMKAMSGKYPESLKDFKLKRGSETEYENKYEHVADALAAFESAREGSLVRLLQK